MNERAVIIARLNKKEAEIQSLEERLHAARIYVQALQDILKVLVLGQGPDEAEHEAVLRPGSSVARARDVILRLGHSAHISLILEELGQHVTRQGRASLTSSLAAYVRRGEIFTRPAPNTFGLIELGHTPQTAVRLQEPPRDFGRVDERADPDEI